jgi:Flp pilus assembly protein TadD
MSRDNIVYTICGVALGLVVGSFLIGPRLARSRLAGSNTIASADVSASSAAAMPPAGGASVEPTGGAAAGAIPSTGPMAAVRQQLDTLKQRIATNPNDVQALSQLANMYMDVGKFPQAIGYYEQALRVRDDPNVRTDLGICYKQAGQLDKSYAEFARVVEMSPGQWQPLYNLAIVLAEMHRYDEARVQVAKLKQLRPSDPDVQKLEQALASVK